MSGLSMNSLLLAFMLMDDNVSQIESDDPGDIFILWLHDQLAKDARCNESDSAARHFLGRPQSLEGVLDSLQLIAGKDSSDADNTPLRSAASG